jgi:hypothetical protein
MRFLHTADWQLGKPYARVTDPDKRSQLHRERFGAIGRLGELTRQQGASSGLTESRFTPFLRH